MFANKLLDHDIYVLAYVLEKKGFVSGTVRAWKSKTEGKPSKMRGRKTNTNKMSKLLRISIKLPCEKFVILANDPFR